MKNNIGMSLIPNFLKEDIFLFLPFPQKLLEIQKNFPTFSCLTDPFFPAIVFVSRFLVRIPFQTIQQHFLTKQDSKIRRTSEKEAFSERERRKVPCAGAESGGGKEGGGGSLIFPQPFCAAYLIIYRSCINGKVYCALSLKINGL